MLFMERQGYQNYFETVYHDTFKRLSQFVFFKVAGLATAEDIVAAVYTDFFQYVVMRGKHPENVLAYLIKMANHELSRHYTQTPIIDSFNDEILNLSESIIDDSDIETEYFEKIDNEALWQAVQQLTGAEQQVIFARFRFDLTFREIAEAVNQNESTIKLRFYRSLKKLRKTLE